MALNKKGGDNDEIVDSGLGFSLPDEVEEGVKTLKLDDSSEATCICPIEKQYIPSHCLDSSAGFGYMLDSDKEGDNLLHLAIANGNENIALRFIALSSLESINAQNYIGQTPLMVAVLVNMCSAVRKLIDAGADLKLCDSQGNNIIHLAAEYGNDSSLVEMFSHSQLIDMKKLSYTYQELIESRNYEGFTPFHVAVRGQKFKTAKLLREIGADVNAMDYKAGFTSLHHLVQNGNLAHLQSFIDEFQPAIDAQSYSGLTPLHLTMKSRSDDVAAILIINGADTEKECMDGISWSSVMQIYK